MSIGQARRVHDRTDPSRDKAPITQSESRLATIAEVVGIQAVAAATDLFPAEMGEELIPPLLEQGLEEGSWLVRAFGGETLAFFYAAPERLTQGTWNMLALAIHPSGQKAGLGRAIGTKLEDVLPGFGQRMIVVDTSSSWDFVFARAFYDRVGYSRVARNPDCWDEGDDKVVLCKRLTGGPGGL